jgi:hypothetical protein
MKLSLPPIAAALWLLTLVSAPAGEWKDLCNGKDLTGWKDDSDHNHWSVKDGVIIGKSDAKKKGSILWTEEEFENFIFETDFRWSGIIDSGVFVKSTRYQVNLGISSSLKVDMSCSIYAPKDGAGKYPGKAEGVDKLLKKDDWNKLRVEAKGSHIIVTLNGTQVLDYETKEMPESGAVGVQVHAGHDMKIEFRNPRIQKTGK